MKKKLIALMMLSGIVRAAYVPTAQLAPILAIPHDVAAVFVKLPADSKIQFIAPIIRDRYPGDTAQLTRQLGTLYVDSLKNENTVMLSAQESALFYYAYALFIRKILLPDLELKIKESTVRIRRLDRDIAQIARQIGSLSNDLWDLTESSLSEEQQSLLSNKRSALSSEYEKLSGIGLSLAQEIREIRTIGAVLQERLEELLLRLTSSHRERLFPRGAVIFAWANLAILHNNRGNMGEAKKDMDMALRMITDDVFDDRDFLSEVFIRAKGILGIKDVESRSIYKKFFPIPKSSSMDLKK